MRRAEWAQLQTGALSESSVIVQIFQFVNETEMNQRREVSFIEREGTARNSGT